ncbi:hypothetical protein KJ815_03375, partial [bacterium]|nr:hypothetical protein [bacterium]
MKFLRIVLIVLSLAAITATAHAQGFTATLQCSDPSDNFVYLNDTCTGGNPLQDGTVVKIYRDVDSDGPDWDDPLAEPCELPPDCPTGPAGTHNYNQFAMNGFSLGIGHGTFYTETAFQSAYGMPTPARYYCRICLPTLHWVSEVFTVSTGPQTVYLDDWTCNTEPCQEACPTPSPVQGFQASENECGRVLMTWNAYPRDTTGGPVDTLVIYRAGVEIKRVRYTATSYVDSTGVVNTTYWYGIKARRDCPTDTSFSPLVEDQGTPRAIPQTPQSVVATDANCGYVRISWTYTSNAGMDSFRVTRNDTTVGWMDNTVPAGPRQMDHFTTNPAPARYCVVGWNRLCGEGIAACDSGTARQGPTGRPGNVQASDTYCDSIVVTWADTALATGYYVIRYTDTGGTRTVLNTTPIAPGVQRYRTNPPTYSTNYRFTVQGWNSCSTGPEALYDLGIAYTVPGQVVTPTASYDTYCTHVALSWTDVANETGYRILRSSVAIDSVAANVVTYNDVTGTPGTGYSYQVQAKNNCGYGTASSSVTGRRKAAPGQVLTVAASDSIYCWGVRVTWASMTGVDSFQIKRNGSRIGVALTGATSYNDSTAIAGLLYNYSVTAYNNCGSGTESASNSGSTKPRPPQVTGLAASDTSCRAIHLVWNNVALEDSFRVLRNGTFLATRPRDSLTYRDTTATPGTHTYRVVAANTCGSGDTSSAVIGERIPSLAAVTGVVATDDSCGFVRITWNNIAEEDSFQILRDGTRIGGVAADVITFTDNTATPWTTYGYTVVGYNQCGAGAASAVDSGYAAAIPAQMTVPVWASDNACDSVYITWTSIPQADSFWVYRNGTHIGTVPYVWQFYSDFSATPGQRYQYTVTSWNHCGESGAAPADSGGSLIFPSVPQNLTATTNLCDRIELGWTASTGDVDRYVIYREGTAIDTILGTLTTYTDNTTASGVFNYRVAAFSEQCGVTAQSAIATGERLEEAGQVTNVQATRTRCDSILVTWNAATGDVDGYLIYVGGAFLDSMGALTTTYGHVPDTAGAYAYTVRAYSEQCGNGALSDPPYYGNLLAYPSQVTGLTTTVNRCDGVMLQWQESTGSVHGYIVRRDAANLDTVETTLLLTVSYFDSTAPDGNSQYDVIAYSENCTDAAPSNAVTGTVLPDATPPTDVAATDNRCDSVVVTWTASTGTFDYYKVYRDGTLPVTVMAPLTRYAEAPDPGDTIRYTVTAVDTVCGETDSTAGAPGLRQADAGIPTNLTATNTCEGVNLVWRTSTGIPEGYYVYRGPNAQNFILIATVIDPDTMYQDTTGERGVNYVYAVSAYTSGCGETGKSNQQTAMRLPLLVAVTGVAASTDSCSGIRITWTALPGADRYRVYRNDVFHDSIAAGDPNPSYYDTTVAVLTDYFYTIAARNICGVGELSDPPATGSRYAVPAGVMTLQASDTSCAAVYLTWTAVARAAQYVIYRNGSPIDSVNSAVTTYRDSLAPAQFTTHAYVVRGKNHCGLGPDQTPVQGYRIPGVAQVTQVWASQNYCGGISVTWLDLPNESGYYVYRDGGFIAEVSADEQHYPDSDIEPGSTHYYRVSAFNVCGEGVLSDSVQGHRYAVPAQVQNVAATTDSCTSVTVTWTDVATEDSFRVYRGGSLIATLAANTLIYRDEPLAPGPYTYTVEAMNYCGNAPMSAVANGYVADVPAVVQNLAATMDHCTTVTVTWNDLADELNYELFRDAISLVILGQNVVSYVDTPEVGTHDYTIRVSNNCGIGELSGVVVGERQGVPTGAPFITVPDSACDTVYFCWTAVDDITRYYLYRNGVHFGDVSPELTCFWNTSPGGTVVGYSVQGYNECGFGPMSNVDSVYFVPTPGQVTGLTATTDNCNTVTLDWTDVQNESGYYVKRANVTIATLPANSVQYVDNPAVGFHWYKVQAFNDCGSGLASDSVQGRRWDVPAQVPGVVASDTMCAIVRITWNNVADEDSFQIRRDGNRIGVRPADSLAFNDTTAVAGTTYAYTVAAYNRCGPGPVSAADNGYRATVPVQVTGVQATINRCDSVIVTWTDVATETLYRIFRDAVEVGTRPANATRFADQPDTGTYQYTVRAENSCGNGTLSTAATGTRLVAPLAPTSVIATDTLCNRVIVTWQ